MIPKTTHSKKDTGDTPMAIVVAFALSMGFALVINYINLVTF
jgi:hypothetical protein